MTNLWLLHTLWIVWPLTLTDEDALLLNRLSVVDPGYYCNARAKANMDFMCSSNHHKNTRILLQACFLLTLFSFSLQHPYVYGVLVLEACATFTGQLSVLSVIAFLGAATTAMVCFSLAPILFRVLLYWNCRQSDIVKLLLSYMISMKPLTKQHWCGLLLMCMGIIMKILQDNKPLPPRPQKTSPLCQTEKPSETEDNIFQIGTVCEEEEEKRDLWSKTKYS